MAEEKRNELESENCETKARFGKWLSTEDLEICFAGMLGSYEIDYMVKKLKKDLADRNSGTGVKNRRYEALVRLEKDTDYFSEYEMRQRCPLLYEEYIGRFMTQEEKLKRDEMGGTSGEVTLSSFIFQQIDRDWLQERQEVEREREQECMEEEEEEEEEENGKIEENTPPEIIDISEEEKVNLRQEFLILMKHKFLEGQDKDFDYSKVDTSEEFDNLQVFSQDEEDRYFDEEEPEACGDSKNKEMTTDSDEEDYLSDKILQKCCSATR